jgi:hypothetical protein
VASGIGPVSPTPQPVASRSLTTHPTPPHPAPPGRTVCGSAARAGRTGEQFARGGAREGERQSATRTAMAGRMWLARRAGGQVASRLKTNEPTAASRIWSHATTKPAAKLANTAAFCHSR